MLVKNVRKTTVLPNQRMHASSRKRMTKLIRRARRGREEAPGVPRQAGETSKGLRPTFVLQVRRIAIASG